MKMGVFMSSTFHLHCVEMTCGLSLADVFAKDSSVDLKDAQ